jgi:hypothetical protein
MNATIALEAISCRSNLDAVKTITNVPVRICTSAFQSAFHFD